MKNNGQYLSHCLLESYYQQEYILTYRERERPTGTERQTAKARRTDRQTNLRSALNKHAMKRPGSPGRPCSMSITKNSTIWVQETGQHVYKHPSTLA